MVGSYRVTKGLSVSGELSDGSLCLHSANPIGDNRRCRGIANWRGKTKVRYRSVRRMKAAILAHHTRFPAGSDQPFHPEGKV